MNLFVDSLNKCASNSNNFVALVVTWTYRLYNVDVDNHTTNFQLNRCTISTATILQWKSLKEISNVNLDGLLFPKLLKREHINRRDPYNFSRMFLHRVEDKANLKFVAKPKASRSFLATKQNLRPSFHCELNRRKLCDYPNFVKKLAVVYNVHIIWLVLLKRTWLVFLSTRCKFGNTSPRWFCPITSCAQNNHRN